jgi:hypothetical protein
MTGLRRWATEQPLPSRLHWTAEYFRWCGMSSVVSIGGTLAFLLVMPGSRAAIAAHPIQLGLALVSLAVTSASWWWTGQRLLGRHRDGAWWAIVALVVPILERARGGAGVSGLAILISVLGLFAILTSWRELD